MILSKGKYFGQRKCLEQRQAYLLVIYTCGELLESYSCFTVVILEKEFDRRNFRKKLLSLGLITDTNKVINFEGKKPAKLYKFNKTIKNKNTEIKTDQYDKKILSQQKISCVGHLFLGMWSTLECG